MSADDGCYCEPSTWQARALEMYFPKELGRLNGFIITRPKFNLNSGFQIRLPSVSMGIYTLDSDVYVKYLSNQKPERQIPQLRLEIIFKNYFLGTFSNKSFERAFEKESGIWVNKGRIVVGYNDSGDDRFKLHYAYNTVQYEAFETLVEFARTYKENN